MTPANLKFFNTARRSAVFWTPVSFRFPCDLLSLPDGLQIKTKLIFPACPQPQSCANQRHTRVLSVCPLSSTFHWPRVYLMSPFHSVHFSNSFTVWSKQSSIEWLPAGPVAPANTVSWKRAPSVNTLKVTLFGTVPNSSLRWSFKILTNITFLPMLFLCSISYCNDLFTGLSPPPC